MIEKLKRPVKIGGTTFREKINELVDAVNELKLSIKPILEERESGIKVCEEAQDMYDNAILDALKNKEVDVAVEPTETSKDIWHFPSEAPAYCFQCVFYDTASNEYHFGQYSPVFKHFRSGNAGWEHEEVQRFAFAKDIIACLDDLERTRKALDKAKWWLHEIVENHRYTPISTAEIALKEITALEQKDTK